MFYGEMSKVVLTKSIATEIPQRTPLRKRQGRASAILLGLGGGGGGGVGAL